MRIIQNFSTPQKINENLEEKKNITLFSQADFEIFCHRDTDLAIWKISRGVLAKK